MTRSLRATPFILALAGFCGLLGTSNVADAQCAGPGGHCGLNAYVGAPATTHRGAQIVVTVGQPPPPPVVYVRPAPPPPPQVVYVQPAPPPPQVVYVRPAPQPVYQQQPVYQPQPVYPQQPRPYPQPRQVSGTSGLHFFISGAGGSNARLGGFGGAIRLRPTEHVALDLGVAIVGGSDYYGRGRAEIPLTADALFFVNPQHKVQLYLLGGVGMSFAYTDSGSSGRLERSYTYFGAETGVGLEFRLTRRFALNTDLRGFLRRQTGGEREFVSSSGDTTRGSGGWIAQGGMTFYF